MASNSKTSKDNCVKMKKKFSKSWKSSKKPNKQRKYRSNAPLHIRGKFMHAHLSKELRDKYKKRSVRVRKGDSVKIVRGNFKGKVGKVERVDLKNLKIFVSGVDLTKSDGTKKQIPIDPSNVVLTELNIEDKKRKARLEK